MQIKTGFLSLFCLIVLSAGAFAQTSSMDKVFVLGDAETDYEKMTSIYSQSMLEAADMDIAVAFSNWLGMLQEIDGYAEEIDYDIKGVKVWLHVFWNEQGGIDKLGFLLRPDSRYIETDELRAFFAGFIKQYAFPLTSDRKFNHYTGATFPTISEKNTN